MKNNEVEEKSVKKFRRRGISPLIAIVIIVSTTMYISIAVTLWMTGIIGSLGYGTRPIILKVWNPISHGRLFRVYVRNMVESEDMWIMYMLTIRQ